MNTDLIKVPNNLIRTPRYHGLTPVAKPQIQNISKITNTGLNLMKIPHPGNGLKRVQIIQNKSELIVAPTLVKLDFPKSKEKVSNPQNNPLNTQSNVEDSQKLYIVKDGELKLIRTSNIAQSGILRPVQKAKKVKPILPKIIIATGEMQPGIMTHKDFQQQLEKIRISKEREKNKIPQNVVYTLIKPMDLALESAANSSEDPAPVKKNRPGRKKGVLNKKQVPLDQTDSIPGSRTRSGRISRPPRHIHSFYSSDSTFPVNPNVVTDLDEESWKEVMAAPPSPKRKFNPPKYKCNKCGKLYVSEAKLRSHWMAHPEHEEGATKSDDIHQETHSIDCFGFLIEKLKKIPLNLRGKIFLDEMEEFMTKVQHLMKKLIRNLDETRNKDSFLNYSQVHQIPKQMENVLNIPAGQYHFNMEVIEQPEILKPTPEIPPEIETTIPLTPVFQQIPIISLSPAKFHCSVDELFQTELLLPPEEFDEEEEEEEDDLITPHKAQTEKPSIPRKIKHGVVKNLNPTYNNFATPLDPGPNIPVLPPKIPDLSLELFQFQRP